jgi:hypothetical protein
VLPDVFGLYELRAVPAGIGEFARRVGVSSELLRA